MAKAKQMALTLLEVGATSSQADLNGITAFHYYVHNGTEAMLTLFDNDKAAALSVLNHIAVSGGAWSSTTSSPLITALDNRDPITALKLLDAGGSRIDYAIWIRAARTALETRWNHMNNPDANLKLFNKSVEQPIILAVEKEQPKVILEMLAKGTDPNTLTKISNEILQDEYQRRYNKGETLIEIVRKKLHELRKFKGEKQPGSPPMPLKDDDHYLSNLEPGTYRHWAASTNLKNARIDYERQLETHQKGVKKLKQEVPGLKEQQAAISEIVNSFEMVERKLLQREAKTFKQLHPDIADPDQSQNTHHSYEPSKPKPFEVTFSFAIGELTDGLKELYLQLYVFTCVVQMAVLILRQVPSFLGRKSRKDQVFNPYAASDCQHNTSTFENRSPGHAWSFPVVNSSFAGPSGRSQGNCGNC
jgi:ankyrin repeat protein